MSFGEKALASGGIAGVAVFGVCCTIPIVGALVGVIAGGVTFLVVESGALIGYGAYQAGVGTYHGIKHLHDRHHKKHHGENHTHKHRFHRKHKHKENQSVINNDVSTNDGLVTSTTQIPTDNSYSNWMNARNEQASSVTQFGIYQPVTSNVSSVHEVEHTSSVVFKR